MRREEKVIKIIEGLKEIYPEAICSLNASNPFELLVATILSAQCTDARVNIVTPSLFEKYPTPQALADANVSDVEILIKSCGLYKTKAKNIVSMAAMLRDDFNSIVPDTIEDLIKLPGVGRKVANLIVGDVYHKESVVVDTHMIRISNRLGIVRSKDPYKIEMSLRKVIPESEGSDFCHRIVLFGRDICSARSPKCEMCSLSEVCSKIGVK